jgi:ribonuclease D
VAGRAARAGRLAIDTEFVSEGRYQALLCLAQVAVRDPEGEVHTAVLDPLDDDQLDPQPIAEVLSDPSVEVVMHAGRQDVAIMRRSWDTDVTRVFDTQVAAGFVGLGTQEGYESLVRKVLRIPVRGGEGFTRWDRRPLTKEQLSYARDDAEHLLDLGEALEERLEEAGRLEWAREECAALERASDDRTPEQLFERLPQVGRLKERQRAVAWELVRWREETARELDKPAGWMLSDRALVEVARRMPSSKQELESVRGVSERTLHRRHKEVLAGVERGREGRAPELPDQSPTGRRADDAPLVALSQAVVRHRSLESRIAAELIATQGEVQRLVSGVRRDGAEPDVRVLSGWRRELVGEELLELLGGRRSLSVGRGGKLEIGD